MQITVKASRRTEQGTRASRRLRRAGRVPGIVYGGDKAPQPITLDHNEIYHQLNNEAFHASILMLEIDGERESVLLRDAQWHAYKPLVLHVDFQRVSANEKIHVNVPLHFVNIDESPAGKAADVSVTSELNDLDIVCLPKDLPEFIEIDLGKIEAGDTVYLADVKLPAGVELSHPVSEEHNPAVAVARFVKGEVEEEASDEVPADDVPAIDQRDDEAAQEEGEAKGE